jgi:hypothetical protein
LIEDSLKFPIKRDVVFNVGEQIHSGYVSIIGIESRDGIVVAHLVVNLELYWEGTVSGVDLLQALSLSTKLLDLRIELANARIQEKRQ